MPQLKPTEFTASPPAPLKTAVLFLVFNRPDVTAQVFEAIRKAKPPRLYIAADGPRESKAGEAERCAEVRRIATDVDWPCEVKTLFREKNLGCKLGVSGGISWFFENEEEGIILEDDCLPDSTFFRFCEELLERYRDDQRIAMISGDNFQFGRKRGDASYYFSIYTHIWGWASWRRAWAKYDVNMHIWPKFRDRGLLKFYLQNKKVRKFFFNAYEKTYAGYIDTWDYQWCFSAWANGMLSIMPNVNLISNIGFGPEATHTRGSSIFSEIEREKIVFPLVHVDVISPDFDADVFTSDNQFSVSIAKKVFNKIRSMLRL